MNKYLYNNALIAVDKSFTREKLQEYLYGTDFTIEQVWSLVEEIHEIGVKAFKEKYKEYLNE